MNPIMDQNITEKILNFILNPPSTPWLITLRLTFISISLVLAVAIVILLFLNLYLRRLFIWDWIEFLTFKPYQVGKKMEKEWEKIKRRLRTGLESEYKLAVIEGYNIFEGVMKKMGNPGENLEEILQKLGPGMVSNLEELEEVYKICENVIHDPDYRLDLSDAKKTLDAYEKALIELEAI